MDALCLADAASTHLASQPITEDERRRGEALRVVRCVRADKPGLITWAVLYFKRGEFADEKPRLSGVSRWTASLIDCWSVPGQVRVRASDESWNVREFGVVLPLKIRSFALRCGTAVCAMGWSCRNAALDAHYLEIRHAAADDSYERWLSERRSECSGLESVSGPLMSIVTPAYKTPPSFLREMIDSICAQQYDNWELVLVNASPEDEGMREVLSSYDDERIKVVELPRNEGIAGNTNAGIAAARGEYVSFLDHDDLLEPDALLRYVNAIEASDEPVDMLYCDEDSLNEFGAYGWPLFKPSFNLDLLYSNNYVIHWLTVSRFVLDQTIRSTKTVDGAQDYDLTLKASEVARKIVRIPRVLYHWRIHQGSINANPDSKPYAQLAGQRALEEHFRRRGVAAQVHQEDVVCTYHSVFLLHAAKPKIACALMGDADAPSLLRALEDYAIVSGTGACELLRFDADTPTNRQRALEQASGELVLYVSMSVGEVGDSVLAVLAGCLGRPEVAAVSPRVLRCDGLVDYAGICMRPDGALMYMSRYLPSYDYAYVGRSRRPYDALVINHEFMMVRVADARRAGGFDASFETSAYASACLCMNLNKRDLSTVFLASSQVSRALPATLLASSVGDTACEDRLLLAQRFGGLYEQGDPSHNPNFDPCSPYYRLRW